METDLFHIIDSATWQRASSTDFYEPASLASEGFIHLSQREQILRPANLLYTGRDDLELLIIDSHALSAPVVFEPGSHGERELFPHLYGPLDVAAVRRVVGFPCGDDGRFTLPDGI